MAREVESQATLAELEAEFEAERATNKRAAAETAYALAFRYRNEDVNGTRHFDTAGEWARRAIDLLDSLPSGSPSDVASTRESIGGIPIPGLLHSDVVRDRLGDVLY
ncbi:hypothetical protein ACFORO_16725 [Amycolatopsis halotolerans]|uniref:Uncharacterized protein n=1 Tax=Amycolatopsis halotolerans TaxID=330083 RepID=A0ABV7QJ01_9PSEU